MNEGCSKVSVALEQCVEGFGHPGAGGAMVSSFSFLSFPDQEG